MEIKVAQTADPIRYKRMLEATSKTATAYCKRHDLSYESFIGIKRGFYGCHAAFNRMFMLTELVERGWRGWVLYMDADAYVHDLNFDLRTYLETKAGFAAVMATIDGEVIPWHINTGVLMFNLGHPVCPALLYDWRARFTALDEAKLKALTSVWSDDNDQSMLSSALYDHPEWRDQIYFERSININHVEGTFIRQYLNAFDQDLETRTDTLERSVSAVLLRHGIVEEKHKAALAALYRAALGREPDDAGFSSYVAELASRNTGDGIEYVLNALLDSAEGRAHGKMRYGLTDG